MAQSMHSLSQYGQAFDTGLVAAGLMAAIAVAACILACALPAQCSCLRRRLAERRYVRAGLRELEHYLAAPPRPGHRR
jgi:L-alanine-DL-glutamate epimerase-like enolase superfamily enzyme